MRAMHNNWVCSPRTADVTNEILATDGARASTSLQVTVVSHGVADRQTDMITLEEPLEIRLAHGSGDARTEQTISITMRTPGQDSELALGFLFTEGIVASANDVDSVEHCGPPSPDKGLQNVVKVELAPGVEFDSDLLARHFYTTSSCGVCGKTSIAAVRARAWPAER